MVDWKTVEKKMNLARKELESFHDKQNHSKRIEKPLEILKIRLARSEIYKTICLDLKRVIEGK